MAASATGLAAFADRVRADTGTDKVDLVGHSQGGLVARQYVKFDGGPDHVRILQMVPGADFLNALNEGDATIGDVRYTSIYTDQDPVVVPVASTTLDDGATNVRVQDHLPDNRVGHQGMASDPAVRNDVEDALRGEPVDLTR